MPELADSEVPHNGLEPAQAIFSRVGCDQEVKLFDPARPQVRRNDFFSGVPASSLERALAGGAAALPASVDEHRRLVGEHQENGVASPAIERGDFQHALGKRGRKRIEGYEDGK